MPSKQVFISYAWGGESELVANELEQLFSQKSIELVRDKTDLGFKGLIREFMQEIGQGNLVLLIISDKYLKSKNCMFELMEVEKKGEFLDRIFPIVLPDSNIYDSLGILSYLKYWDQKIKELNASAKELDSLADTRKVQEDINLYTDIRGAIDDLAGKLSNMNTLTLEIMRKKNYQPLFDAIEGKLAEVKESKSDRKEGKVLYHIPSMMQVDAWTRCTVRLAWDEILLLEDLTIPKEAQVIESIRLGNIMQVSLAEGRETGNFSISPLNNEEQFISEDDYTQWLFDVKPLKLGNFTLILRVTLIQVIEGRERKKDIVLEREVTTETLVPKALPKFETAEKGLLSPAAGAQIYPELGEDTFDTPAPAPPPHISIPKPEVAIPPAASFPLEPSTAATRPLYKKILPYAASVAGIALVATLFLQNNSSLDYETMGQAPDLDTTVFAGDPPELDETVLIAMKMESALPGGETTEEILVVAVKKEDLKLLQAEDLGVIQIDTIPDQDTSMMNLGSVKILNMEELKDTIKMIKTTPQKSGINKVQLQKLKFNPDFQ